MGVAEEIEYALLFRIKSGQYPLNARLPSVRDMAREFGVNKNTITRVYQSLIGQGYLRTVIGKGVYVASSPRNGMPEREAEEFLSEQLTTMVWRAKMLGLPAAAVRALFDNVMSRVYSSGHVRLVFVECNQYDAETLGKQVEAGIGIPMRLLLLRDFKRDAAQVCRDADIIVTTFYHLAEVRDAVAAGASAEVVGVHAPPEPNALLRVARVPQGSRVLVVCTEATTLNTLSNQVRAYNSGVEVDACLIGRGQDICSLLHSADYVIDTHTSHEMVAALQPEVPVITISFAVDQQSLDFLRRKVEQAAHDRLAVSVS
ncbi:MAG: GntR family transcriptional regulator [Anaerolineae bacterium]